MADSSDAPLPDVNYTSGAGIRVQKADTIRIDNVDVRRKEHGVMLGQVFDHFEYGTLPLESDIEAFGSHECEQPRAECWIRFISYACSR